VTGNVHLVPQFRSTVLGNERNISIYLPPGYDAEPDRRYPVLYMHDGQNLFDGATAFIPGQHWRLDETATALIAAHRIAPLIIVGIDHARERRGFELTPTRDAKVKDGGGGGLYAQMIHDELKPVIDATYRTWPDRDHTATGGSSLGGLVSLSLGFSMPETFGRVMAMSPSLWWDRRSLLQQLRASTDHLPLRIWLDTGTAEGGGTLQNTRMLKNALLRNGWRRGQDLQYVEALGAQHTETAWAARVGPALEFLFPI
jgi:predicted alpha/beta superfamily hydrolase